MKKKNLFTRARFMELRLKEFDEKLVELQEKYDSIDDVDWDDLKSKINDCESAIENIRNC